MARDFYYGGQAVIEGVMMRGPKKWAVAIRSADGSIETQLNENSTFMERHAWARVPLIRGVIALGQSLAIGYRALNWSAKKQLEAELAAARAQAAADSRTDSAAAPPGAGAQVGGESEAASGRRSKRAKRKEKGGEPADPGKLVMAISVLMAIVIMIGLFFFTPTLLTRLVDRYIASSFVANLVEGVIRAGVFIGYIFAISAMKDVRRVFMYHGAEHKTIAAYEAGDELTPEAVEKYTTRHVRCGTNFLLLVVLLSIAVYSVFGRPAFWIRFGSRLVLIPLIAGVSYEIIRLAARSMNRPVVRFLMAPGLALQSLTTREPTLDQIEVAIASMDAVIDRRAELELLEGGTPEDDAEAGRAEGARASA